MSFITISIFCKSAFTHLNFTWASCLYQSKLAIQRTFLRKRTKYTIHDFDEWSGWRMKLILHSSTSLVEIINQTHYTIRSLVNSAFHLVFLLIDQFHSSCICLLLNKESAFMNPWRPSWNDSWMLILYEVDS